MFNLRDFTIAWQKLAQFEFKGSNFKHFFIYSTQYNQRIQRIWKNLCKKDKVENQHWMLWQHCFKNRHVTEITAWAEEHSSLCHPQMDVKALSCKKKPYVNMVQKRCCLSGTKIT